MWSLRFFTWSKLIELLLLNHLCNLVRLNGEFAQWTPHWYVCVINMYTYCVTTIYTHLLTQNATMFISKLDDWLYIIGI